MKTKKNQSVRILNAQTQLLNYKIMEMNMTNNSLLSSTEKDSNYVVTKNLLLPNDNSQVTVSIYFGGENQFGSAKIKILRTNEPVKFIKSSTDNIILGICSDLIGNVLCIAADITDSNQVPENNNTVLTVKIMQQNRVLYDDKHTVDVGNEGSTASFTYYLTFY